MKEYRALLSVPIEATDDADAARRAADHAGSLLEPEGKGVVGHVELVGEVRRGMEIVRVVREDPLFLRQLPPDWKP